MGNLSPKGEGRGEGKDSLDLGVWVQKRLHPHPFPKGEGRPTDSLVLELWAFGPADSLNAYGGRG
jgi:hypothetical protein